MKCKACNGTGKIMATIYENDEIGFVDKTYNCCRCNGTGKIKITNEEWFCTLSTEEKVAALVDLHKKVRIKMRTEIGGENRLFNGDYHREWLKEIHE